MSEPVQHKNYKGHDIRSSSFKILMAEKKRWKVRLHITILHGNGTETIPEYLAKADSTQLKVRRI